MRASDSLRALPALLALCAAPALADWKDDYSRGLEAVREGRWAEATRLMESALAGNAQPAARLRLYGQRYEVYAPQHYLGLAALRRGDCAGALRWWNEPANRSFVGGNAALSGVEAGGRSDCSTAVAAETKPPATPAVAETRPPPAQTRPAATEPKTPARPPARPPAEPPQRPLAQTPAETRPAPAEPPKTVSAGPADALRPMLDAYLGGRYAEVLRLTARPATDSRIGWHLQTLRAASAWQISQLAAEPGDAEATARAAAAAARKLAPGRRPDATFYPPRFVAFYDAS